MNRREFIKLLSSVTLVPSLAGIPIEFAFQNISTVFADQFVANVNRICQQKESRLRGVIV